MERQSWLVKKSGVATKLKTNFALKIFNMHCICHRIALACADTCDDYKFKRNAEEILIELWRFFKTLYIYEGNSPQKTHDVVSTSLRLIDVETTSCVYWVSAKEFDSLTEMKKKNYVKLLKKTCRTRWLSLHADVDVAFGEYKGLGSRVIWNFRYRVATNVIIAFVLRAWEN